MVLFYDLNSLVKILFFDVMKKNKHIYLLFIWVFLLFPFVTVFSQGPGCPNVDAGLDVNIDCVSSGCADLTATFLETGESTSYDVASINYAPFPFVGGTNVSVGYDDRWSPAINLPFNFCFFGGTYDEIVIGSNGVISFDLNSNPPNGGCTWNFGLYANPGAEMQIPSPDQFKNTIFGVYMDINPSQSPISSNINYQVIGSEPCRTMVISYPNIAYYNEFNTVGCDNQSLTSQIVLYETTNVVEVYVLERASGCSWNSGKAVIGIQDGTGTLGYAPPGRNTGDWSASMEGWRFTPNGLSNIDFNWLDSTGTIVGSSPTLSVCPADTEIYTARASYLNCDGQVTVVTDDVTVTTSDIINVDLGLDQDTCTTDDILLTANTTGAVGLFYQWFFNGVSQGPSTIDDTTFTVTAPNSGTYSVEVFNSLDTSCIGIDSVEVLYKDQPIANEPNDLFQCDDGVNTGIFDLTVNDAVVLGAQAPTDYVISYHNTAADAAADVAAIVPATAYTITGTVEEIFVRIEDSTGTCFATDSFFLNFFAISVDLGLDQDTCTTDDILLTANTAGAVGLFYQWFFNGVSQGPSTIDDTTFTVTAPNSGTYSVEVFNSLDTSCIGIDSVEVLYKDQPIANEPNDLFQCDDGVNAGIFDLTVNDAVVLGAQAPTDYVISYHNTAADAAADVAAIVPATAYTITGTVEEIFVRIEDSTGTCFATDSFFLNFFAISVDLGLDQDTCTTDDILLTANTAGAVGLFYQWFFNGVSQGPSTIDDTTFTVTAPNSGTYSVEVFNSLDTTCIVIDSVEVLYKDQPIANEPNDLFQCDDGVNAGIFDLTVNDAVVLGAQAPTDYVISYHNTAADAAADVAAIVPATAYTITGTVEEIFVRIEDSTGTCFATDSFFLNFFAISVDLGLDQDTCTTDDILLTANTAGAVGLFYQWFFNGVSQGPSTIDDTTFTVTAPNSGTYSVEVFNSLDTTCIVIDSVEVTYKDQPIANEPNDLFQCDDGVNAGIFDLTVNDVVVLGAQAPTDYVISYHNTAADAAADVAAIVPATAYTITGTVEEIFVRIEDSTGTCFATDSFFLNFFAISVDLGLDQDTCTTDDILLTANTAGAVGLFYQWFFNGVSQGPSTIDDTTFTVTAPNSGTYSVEVFNSLDTSCIVTRSW